jgi:integrase
MVTLATDARGNYKARKRLPDDVKDEYARLYGPRLEAKFFAPASTKANVAKQLFNEWLADTEARIDAIRAARKGEGRSLTHRQARALAGEWYDWYVARHPENKTEDWEHVRDTVHDALRAAAGEKRWENSEPDELWQEDEDLRKAIRPVLADAGETAQFLAMKSMALNNEAREPFLDFVYEDLAQALKRLIRMSGGDYSTDTYRERFPKFEAGDTGETPWQLFERWVHERKPKFGSVENWRYVFRAMNDYFKDRSAASIAPVEAQQWVNGLRTEERSARAVHKTWIKASRTIFGWAVKHKHLQHNPFKDVNVTVPKQQSLRETKAFRPDEYRIILNASLRIADTAKPDDAAKRWVPWLCAYTGARPGEMTQLRKQDVRERDGIWTIHITPEAGTVKGGKARTVPLHEHLEAQGFLTFIRDHEDGPLFYKPNPKGGTVADPLQARKPRWAQARQRLADWVRNEGVTDPELRPNHAWRHTFKQIADRSGITERVSDAITGHAPMTEGRAYGAPTVADMAEALKKFPRYKL